MIRCSLSLPCFLPPQMCGKLDPTFASATLLFQKDPPANVQLFQVSTHGMFNFRGSAVTHDDSRLSFGKWRADT